MAADTTNPPNRPGTMRLVDAFQYRLPIAASCRSCIERAAC
jgi:hypothetical protein